MAAATKIPDTGQVVGNTTRLSDPVVGVGASPTRPMVKGKVGKPVAGGCTVAIDEVDDGFIVGWTTAVGNQPDLRLLAPALAWHRCLFRCSPADTGQEISGGAKRSNASIASTGYSASGPGRRTHRSDETAVPSGGGVATAGKPGPIGGSGWGSWPPMWSGCTARTPDPERLRGVADVPALRVRGAKSGYCSRCADRIFQRSRFRGWSLRVDGPRTAHYTENAVAGA